MCHVFGDLYVAGTDTTSLNSLMALYYLMKNPNVLSKL
jgi:cytochrome P450